MTKQLCVICDKPTPLPAMDFCSGKCEAQYEAQLMGEELADCFACNGTGLDPDYLSFSCEVCEQGKLTLSPCCDAPMYKEGSEGYRCSQCESIVHIRSKCVDLYCSICANGDPSEGWPSPSARKDEGLRNP